LIYSTTDYKEFVFFAVEFSIKNDIVNSPLWANLMVESGKGGDTVSSKIWITDGQKDKYINKTEDIPENWWRGRTTCSFNDSDQQKINSNKRVKGSSSESHKKRYELMRENGIPIAPWAKELKGALNPSSKKVRTPYGDFDYIEIAFKTLGITRYRLMKNIKTDPNNWYFI